MRAEYGPGRNPEFPFKELVQNIKNEGYRLHFRKEAFTGDQHYMEYHIGQDFEERIVNENVRIAIEPKENEKTDLQVIEEVSAALNYAKVPYELILQSDAKNTPRKVVSHADAEHASKFITSEMAKKAVFRVPMLENIRTLSCQIQNAANFAKRKDKSSYATEQEYICKQFTQIVDRNWNVDSSKHEGPKIEGERIILDLNEQSFIDRANAYTPLSRLLAALSSARIPYELEGWSRYPLTAADAENHMGNAKGAMISISVSNPTLLKSQLGRVYENIRSQTKTDDMAVA